MNIEFNESICIFIYCKTSKIVRLLTYNKGFSRVLMVLHWSYIFFSGKTSDISMVLNLI